MQQPAGYEQDKDKVCLLNRSLYGLKQSPRQWNKRFTLFIKSLDLQESENDKCVFFKHTPLLILSIYVDDGLLLGEDEESINDIISKMKNEFEIHEVSVSSYLGFQVEMSPRGDVMLHQTSYIKAILRRFDMENCNSVTSPISISRTESSLVEPIGRDIKYREAVGSLMYAAITTRPDIMFAVMKVSCKVCNPTVADWQAVKRIFRYLKGKEDLGVGYHSSDPIIAFCDADFAGDTETSKSTSGIIVNLSGGPIHWRSQAQKIVTLSSTEAELVSLCTAVKDVIWLRKLALELRIIDQKPSVLFCDNQSTIRLALNERVSQRTRHMSVRAAYPREQVENNQINIKYIGTQEQVADILTKPQSVKNFSLNSRSITMKLSAFNSVVATIMFLLYVSVFIDSLILERTDPILWRPTNKLVYRKRVEFKLLLMWVNPCKEFDDHSNSHPHYNAKKFCQESY